MIGPTLGPTLGGYLTDNFGWRSIFNINLPQGMLAAFIGALVIFDRVKDQVRAMKSKNWILRASHSLLRGLDACNSFLSAVKVMIGLLQISSLSIQSSQRFLCSRCLYGGN